MTQCQQICQEAKNSAQNKYIMDISSLYQMQKCSQDKEAKMHIKLFCLFVQFSLCYKNYSDDT